MVSWIPDDIDKIFRFENFKKIPYEINKLSGNNYKINLWHLRKSNHSNYRDYYVEETRKMVFELYKDDFERFNYSF